ncbi:hypothetical protein Tco_0178205 [Tanacetum coccineum]
MFPGRLSPTRLDWRIDTVEDLKGESKQILALYFALVLVLIIKPVKISLGELWDCQLGSFTAGKDSGGGGNGLSMVFFELQGKTNGISMKRTKNKANDKNGANGKDVKDKAKSKPKSVVWTDQKTYLKSFETLKTQLDDLRIEFNKSEFNLVTYKRGLASVEEQIVFYKKNEVIFYEQIAVLKRDISYKDLEISVLKSEVDKLKQEKESNQLKIENFENASKSLEQLIGCQIVDKSKKGLGYESYHAVPPPPTGKIKSQNVSEVNEPKENSDVSLVEEQMSDDLEKKTVSPTASKVEFVKTKEQIKPVRKIVRYAEMYRSKSPRGNERNWNGHKFHQLGSNFVMYNKACFVCGSFDHVQVNCDYHQRERVVSRNNYSRVNNYNSTKKVHPSAHRNMAPRVVLMKIGLKAVNTVRHVNTAHPKTTVHSARPMSCFTYKAPSTVREDHGYVDSGCSRHMTGNMSNYFRFKEFIEGYVLWGKWGRANGGKITGKGTLKIGKLDFEDVYFVMEED